MCIINPKVDSAFKKLFGIEDNKYYKVRNE